MHNSLLLSQPTIYTLPVHRCQLPRASASVTVSAPHRETDPKKRIVITGMGLVSVFGNDVDKFYNMLLEGKSGIKLIESFDVSGLPTRFAGQIKDFSCKGYADDENNMELDDSWRYCLVGGKKALENAGLGIGTAAHKKVKFEFYSISYFLIDSH
jgi:3-oxoacyl-[acyl-carrier-protein] synthase II